MQIEIQVIMFRNDKIHVYKLDHKNRVDNFRKEFEMFVNKSNEDYLMTSNLKSKIILENG